MGGSSKIAYVIWGPCVLELTTNPLIMGGGGDKTSVPIMNCACVRATRACAEALEKQSRREWLR